MLNTTAPYYIFASDPHGTGEPWIKRVQAMQAKYPLAHTVFGGDYIDGRKFSKQTLQFVYAQDQKPNVTVLLGNHEQMLLDYVNNQDKLDQKICYTIWKENGGKSTIKSLTGRNWSWQKSAKALKLRQPKLLRWLNHLQLHFETPNIYFVHAGVDWEKAKPLSQTQKDDQLWIREEYWYQPQGPNVWAHNTSGKTIVTGHTPTCLLNGVYDYPDSEFLHANEQGHCPITKIQYTCEPARWFCDGGCHSDFPDNLGNIAVFDQNGCLIDHLS